jgi:beta-glucosidase
MNTQTSESHFQKKSALPGGKELCASLIRQMTLDEKVGQMVQADLSWNQDIPALLRAGGIGSLFSIRDPKVIRDLQRIAVEESRLHIPLLIGNDVIHGYRSIFPIPLALASSWDTELIEKVARASIAEAIACGTNWNFAPMVDICRDPRWGRIAEGAGEDPLLGSRVAQAWVKGYQNYSDEEGRCAAACTKHYAAYGGSEAGKDYNSVDMSERRLREEYLPPYHAAIQAGVLTIMTSFNDLNGLPATANPFLLKKILRQEWGFEGLVVSDYDSIGELILHGFAKDHKEAALRSVLAGVDMDMMGNAYHFHLADLVREGKVLEAVLDEAVERILKLKIDLGLFEQPYSDESKASSALLSQSTLDLAAEAATKSIVLLKNEKSLLPLEYTKKTIALIGPLADERQSLMGCWNFDGQASDVETLREALQRNLPADSSLIFEKGCSIQGNEQDFSAAVQAASQADLVILAVGESDTMSGEAHSRAHLGLPGRQQQLADAVLESGKPVVSLVFAGRPLTIPELAEQSAALLMVWHGGTRASQGICNVLLGKANPCGKLTVSFPRNTGQIPVYYAHKNTGRPVKSSGTIQFNEAHRSAYLDESNDPLFPFGYGLGFSNFVYSDLVLSDQTLKKDGVLKVSATITNRGQYAGIETVQLYIRDLVGTVTRPVKELKNFLRISLAPGESKRVQFELPAKSLAFLDTEFKPILESGAYTLWIAPNATEGLEGHFELV